jgi:3-isopropylmalate/(R)-2-methylmalate dehydratase small subunit
MEDIDKDFIRKVRPGDIIVAGENFGCGSSREHAPIALRGAGVSCVIARSFSRIFFRTSVNTGFPVFELSNAYDITEEDELLIDMGEGTATNLTCDEVYPLPSLPPFLKQIFFCGGLLEFIKQRG